MHQLDFIGGLLQAKVNDRVFLKLDSSYADYFPKYSSHFGISFRLKYMYGMTNSGKLFADDLTEWFINEARFIQYQFYISMYYKYTTYVTNMLCYLMLIIFILVYA